MISFIVLFGVGLVTYYLIIYNKEYRIYEMKENIQIFENNGFKISKGYLVEIDKGDELSIWNWRSLFINFSKTIELTKNNIQFTIQKWGDLNDAYITKFEMPEMITKKASIQIFERGYIAKLFGWNKGEFHELNKDYSVVGSNILLVKYILNKPENLKELNDVMKYGFRFVTNGQNEFYSIKGGINSILKVCDELLDLIELFNSFVVSIKQDGEYTIEEIMEDYPSDNVQMNCLICYKEIDNRDMYIFSCCGSVGHEGHIKGWLELNNICPYCKKSSFTLYDLK